VCASPCVKVVVPLPVPPAHDHRHTTTHPLPLPLLRLKRYSKEWEVTVKRLGRWIDFENDYKTLDPQFMESVW